MCRPRQRWLYAALGFRWVDGLKTRTGTLLWQQEHMESDHDEDNDGAFDACAPSTTMWKIFWSAMVLFDVVSEPAPS
jgi:hypothetical protein